MTKDNSTGKNKEFYELGKKMFDAIEVIPAKRRAQAAEDDDTQVYTSDVALAEAYRCGYKDGMEAAAVICENLPVQQEVDVRDECAAAIRARVTT